MSDLQPIIRGICEALGKTLADGSARGFAPDTDYADTHRLIGWMVEKGWFVEIRLNHESTDWRVVFWQAEGSAFVGEDPDFRIAVVLAAARALGVGDD